MNNFNEENITNSISRYVEWVSCDQCKSQEYTTIYPSTFVKEHFQFDKSESFKYASPDQARGNIVKCKNCGLIYMNPRDIDIEKVYENVTHDDYYLSSTLDRISTCERDKEKMEKVIGLGKGRRLLDVGCSYGLFMDVCKDVGWDVYGCELSKIQYDYTKKKHKKIHNTEVSKSGFIDNFFDVVTLFDVIEHLTSPTKFLKEVHKVIKPGGYFIACTPNISSWQAKFFGKKWLNYARMHIYYFTPKSLTKMLETNGFKVVRVQKHKRVIQVGTALSWMKKNPTVYKIMKFFLGNRIISKIKLLSSMSGNMVVYAKKQ